MKLKATELYFLFVLFITLYKVVLTFPSVDEILKRDHSDEGYRAVRFCGAIYYAAQVGPSLSSLWIKILKYEHSNESYSVSSTFLRCYLLCCTRWFPVESVYKILGHT